MSAEVQSKISKMDILREHILWILAAGIVAGAVLPLGTTTIDGYFYSRTESARLLGGGGSWTDWVVVSGLIVSFLLILRANPADIRENGARLIIPSLGWSLGPCLLMILGSNVSSGLPGESSSFSPGLGLYAIIMVAAIASYVGFGLMQQSTSLSNGGISLFVACFVLATWMASLIVFTLLIWVGFNGLVSFPFSALLVFAAIGVASIFGTRAGWNMIKAAGIGAHAKTSSTAPSYTTSSTTSFSPSPIIRATHAITIGNCKLLEGPSSNANVLAVIPAGTPVKLLETPKWMPRQDWISVLDERSGQQGYASGFTIQPVTS